MINPADQIEEAGRGIERPVFLDFVNREAFIAGGPRRNEADDFAIIEVLLLTHCGRLSANISQMVEYCDTRPRLGAWIQKLIKERILISTSADQDISSFVGERQALYRHDRLRYPMYFNNPEKLEGYSILSNNSFSMTNLLRRDIYGIEKGRLDLSVRRAKKGDRDNFAGNIEFFQTIAARHSNAAITRALFAAASDKDGKPDEKVIGSAARIFSALYMEHYSEKNICAVCTGILSTGYQEDASDFPFYDIPLLHSLLESIGYYRTQACIAARKEKSISHYGTRDHLRFCYLCRAMLDSVVRLVVGRSTLSDTGIWESIRASVAVEFSAVFDDASSKVSKATNMAEFLRIASAVVESGGERLAGNATFAKQWRRYVPDSRTMRFLIFAATDVEEDQLHLAAEKAGYIQIESVSMARGVASRYSKLGAFEVMVCRSSAGGSGVSGSHLVAADAIGSIKPHYVVSCGICFGFDDQGLAIGDLLVSESVANYDMVRLSDMEVRERGPILPCGPMLLSAARSVMKKYRLSGARPKSKSGLMLAGDKLVDSPEFMASLRKRFPDAIGGEMEGVGISSASSSAGVEWIIAKAICDWGKNKDKTHQISAATIAAQFVIEMIETIAKTR